jgi:NodT family efflux transporter outer membrane factor (OMF) lipoprotein
MNSRAIVASLAACGLAACTVGPDFIRPTPPAQRGYTAQPVVLPPAGRSDTRQHLVAAPAAADPWWRQFGSPTLDATVAQALADSPTVAQAQAVLAQAQQAVRIAAAGQYPQADLGAAASRSGGPADLGSGTTGGALYSAGPLVSYAPDVFGGTRRSIEQQQALAKVRQAQLDAARLALAANVVEQAIAVASTRAQTTAVDAVLATDRDNVDLVRLAVDAGTGAPADLLAARSQLAGDEALLPPLRQQRAAARDALAMLVGRSAGDWPALPVIVPSALVRSRPDIRAAEAQLHAASAAIGIATANLYPQVSLSASWTQQSAGLGTLFAGDSGLWSVAAGLTAPLFHGGALRAQQQAAVEGFRGQLAVYRQTVLLAFNQVADVLQALAHDAESIAAQRNALDAADASLRLAQESYSAGAGSFLQVLVAQRGAQQARLGYVRAVGQRYLDTVQLFAAMGGPQAIGESAMGPATAAPLASPGFAAYTPAVLAIALGLVGGIIGFVVRPSIPLLGQLPFNVVIRDGAGLTGLSTFLQPAAHQSFELLLGGTVVGAILGLLTGLALKAQRG